MTYFNDYIRSWQRLGEALGLEVVTISSKDLGLDIDIELLPLLKNFGGDHGMILFPSGTRVLKYSKKLTGLGYGFSVLAEPSPAFIENLEASVEMLREWGWVGNDNHNDKPFWL